MEKEPKFRVESHMFMGYSESGSATYQITFNKSLEHTGRLKGIENGLNEYVKDERKKEFKRSFSNVYRSFIRWLNAL